MSRSTDLFTHRSLHRLKRVHWQPHYEGEACLQWRPECGLWRMTGPQGPFELPGGVDLETINQTWDRFVAVANGQA